VWTPVSPLLPGKFYVYAVKKMKKADLLKKFW
jgi:hypothetical protein